MIYDLKKKISFTLTVLLLLSFCFGCMGDNWEDYEDNYSDDLTEDSGEVYSNELSKKESSSNSILSVDNESGNMMINRPRRETETPMGKKDTWTIFVYICGSDLESEDGMATDDLNEMLSASGNENLSFVVETGGASDWYSNEIDRDSIQRFLIQNGEMTECYNGVSASMGDIATLTDFLRWGIQNYPANHMGVIFWDHGGGSINGVCFDENYQEDSLSLLDIDSALYSIYDEMTDRFEFIGFDACLMGTVEAANILASYSRYMYGSEETEPGSGWDYKAIGDYLHSHPDANGEELGKVVCDSFLEACRAQNDDELTTLSVLDLDKIDDVLISFNSFARSMYEAGDDADTLAAMIREIERADNFGGNNKSEGYTNMVDLGGLIEACSSYTTGSSEVLAFIAQAVVYQVSGAMHPNASGLAVYYPLQLEGSMELSIFETISISPYYLSFIDRQDLGSAYASGNYSDADDDYDADDYDADDDSSLLDWLWYDDEDWYDDSYWYDEDQYWNSYCDYEYDEANNCYRRQSVNSDHWKYTDQIEQTGESRLITFSQKPTLNSDGIYTFTLDKRGLENAASVYAFVYQELEDGSELIEIGETFDVVGDWTSGVFEDMFDGYWLTLPDGQKLATYIVDYDDDSILYTSPILLNGEATNLRLRQKNDGTVIVEGCWDGLDEHGAASRKIIKLKDGDRIIPCYFCLNADTFEESEWTGQEFQVYGNLEIQLGLLEEADYYYAFCIDDIYYDYYMTEFESFHLDENGDTYTFSMLAPVSFSE